MKPIASSSGTSAWTDPLKRNKRLVWLCFIAMLAKLGECDILFAEFIELFTFRVYAVSLVFEKM